MLKDKRGLSLQDLYPAVLTIVLVGIVLGVGLYVLAEFRLGIATDYTGTDSVNGSGTLNANTTTLANSTSTGYNLVTATAVYNTTGDSVTITFTDAGVVSYNDTSPAIAEGVNITSTFNYDKAGTPEASTATFITGLATFADWIAIIVVVIAAAIVLGVVLSSFGRRPGV